jgi:anthranilate phosphoribosyltransferase
METLAELTEQAAGGEHLSRGQAAAAAHMLAGEEASDEARHAFLVALARKGERPAEVAGFADAFREMAVDPGVGAWAGRAIDVCGTGGDGSGTFNISTAVSFLVAAAGVPVFKHGNRSITSKCGSADLLDVLGFPLEMPPELVRRSLEALDFCFFFAPAYHPAFRRIMPVRKMLAREGVRSVFNLLGPLINPGRPAHQLLGVFSPDWVAPLAEALGELGLEGGLVVHGRIGGGSSRGLDEMSCAGPNLIAGFGRLADRRGELDARSAGLGPCQAKDLQGGAIGENLALLERLFRDGGKTVPAGLRDSVLLNAGAALWIAGRADSTRTGVARAADLLQSGHAWQWLERARAFYRDSLSTS